MTRPHGWVARFVLVFALAIATSVAAQNTQPVRRRAINPGASDVITILQTTDLHHHANGSEHVGLDVDPSTAMSKIGAYARLDGIRRRRRSAPPARRQDVAIGSSMARSD